MMYGVSNAMAGKFVQIVQNFIADECIRTYWRISDELKNSIGREDENFLQKNIPAFVDDIIVNEYRKLLQTLLVQINDIIVEYSGKDIRTVVMPLIGDEIFKYQFSSDLMDEYGITISLARRYRDKILNMLTGVNKNILLRIQGILLKHYSNIIYEVFAEEETYSELRRIS